MAVLPAQLTSSNKRCPLQSPGTSPHRTAGRRPARQSWNSCPLGSSSRHCCPRRRRSCRHRLRCTPGQCWTRQHSILQTRKDIRPSRLALRANVRLLAVYQPSQAAWHVWQTTDERRNLNTLAAGSLTRRARRAKLATAQRHAVRAGWAGIGGVQRTLGANSQRATSLASHHAHS